LPFSLDTFLGELVGGAGIYKADRRVFLTCSVTVP
jgi:hypothetical protein